MAINCAKLRPADQLKFVMADVEDLDFAKYMLREYRPACNIIFTPVGGVEMKWLVEKVLEERLEARVLPQLHKMIWSGCQRGH